MVTSVRSLPTPGGVSQWRSHLLTPEIIGMLIGVLDFVVVVGGAQAVFWLYLGSMPDKFLTYLAVSVLGAASIVQLFYFKQMYRLDVIARPLVQIRKIVLACTIVLMCLLSFLFALKVSEQLSRVWIFAWFLLSVTGLSLVRTGAAMFLTRQARAGTIGRNAVVVGAGEQGRKLIGSLLASDDGWTRVVGVFDDRTDRIERTVFGYPVLGNLDDLVVYAREHRSDEVIIALPWSAPTRIREILGKLAVLPVRVSLGPDLAAMHLMPTKMHKIGDAPVFEIARQPLSGWHYLLKSIEDWVLGTLLFLLALPLMLVIGILVKLDSPGPVFFRQLRHGFNHQLIPVWKFRTMYTDRTDPDAATLATRDDPRVTRVGAFLRRTSLDEVPQLINVMRGEMSLVGPRPHALQAKAGDRFYADVVAEYAARHKVKPGITGWAQVNGWRGETDTDEKLIKRVEHDLYYIDNWGLWFDFKILLLTALACGKAENAY